MNYSNSDAFRSTCTFWVKRREIILYYRLKLMVERGGRWKGGRKGGWKGGWRGGGGGEITGRKTTLVSRKII